MLCYDSVTERFCLLYCTRFHKIGRTHSRAIGELSTASSVAHIASVAMLIFRKEVPSFLFVTLADACLLYFRTYANAGFFTRCRARKRPTAGEKYHAAAASLTRPTHCTLASVYYPLLAGPVSRTGRPSPASRATTSTIRRRSAALIRSCNAASSSPGRIGTSARASTGPSSTAGVTR